MANQFNITNQNDVINGTELADHISSLDGNDTVKGAANNDIIYGDNGNDTLYGEADNDSLFGGNGNDTVNGDDGNDRVQGGNDDDRLIGGNGNDVLYGGAGNDVVSDGDSALDFTGTEGSDQLFGDAGNDTLISGEGNDTLNGGEGNDILSDGESDYYDIVDYGFTDGNERNVGNDIMNGGAGSDTLSGKYGANTLDGGDGDDILLMDSAGGHRTFIYFDQEINDLTQHTENFDDHNTVTGGNGTDHFRFDDIIEDSGRDIITDFAFGTDKIQLNAQNYAAVGSSVEAGEFANAANATAAGQHLLYDQDNGNLYYDADGSGSGKALHLGTVFNGGVPAELDHTSFEII